MVLVAKVKKARVVRTRGAGTMTESAFWTMIRSALRNKSRFWPPVKVCKEKARRKYKGTNKRQQWEYQCAECKSWFPEKLINVDHIVPAGQLQCGKDLEGFVERLFCETDNLQCLCENCHHIKTQSEKLKK
jgi:5-methylcytosine-specific restriction endonuclease McrA